jgi:hypothetical protein
MKIAIRALVLGMLTIGFAASNMLVSRSVATAPTSTMVASISRCPVPSCEPGKKCGLK